MSDGLTELIGDIYTPADPQDPPSVGSLCWAPVGYPPAAINVIRAISNDPGDPDYRRYRIETVGMGGVGKGSPAVGNRFPDKNLNLSFNEDLFVIRGKVRLVVVFSNPRLKLDPIIKDGVKTERELQNCLGCFPAYTLVDEHGNPSHKPAFVENVQALKYMPFCYVPRHSKLHNRESYLRMDRLFWFPREILQPLDVALNGPGQAYIESWFCAFAGVRVLDQELDALRGLLLEALEAERAKKKPTQ